MRKSNIYICVELGAFSRDSKSFSRVTTPFLLCLICLLSGCTSTAPAAGRSWQELPQIAIGDLGFPFKEKLGIEVLRCDGLDQGLVSIGGLPVSDGTKSFIFADYGKLALQFWNCYFIDLPISGTVTTFQSKGYPKGVEFFVEEAGLISNRDFILADNDWRVVLVGSRKGETKVEGEQSWTFPVYDVARFDRGEEVWRVNLNETLAQAQTAESDFGLVGGEVSYQLCMVDTLVLVHWEGGLMAFSLEDGTLEWCQSVGGGVIAAVGSTPEERSIVVLRAGSANFYAAQDGTSLGRIDYPPILPETVYQDGSGFYVARDNTGTLFGRRGEEKPSIWYWDKPVIVKASIRGVRQTPR